MGEPRQNFAMDSIREFKVSTSTYKAEFGLATGGILSVVTKSGTNDPERLRPSRSSATSRSPRRTYFETDAARLPPLPVRRHRSAVRSSRTRPTTSSPSSAPTRTSSSRSTRAGAGRSTRVPIRATRTAGPTQRRSITSSRQRRASSCARAQEVEYRPIITAGGRVPPDAQLRLRRAARLATCAGHTWVANTQLINDFRLQYAYAKYQVAPPYSHGSWEPGDFGDDRLDLCTPIYNYPSLGLGGCGNSQMGPEKRFQIRTTSRPGPAAGRRTSSRSACDVSYIPFRSTTWVRRSVAGPSRVTPTTTPTTDDLPDAVHELLPTYADIPTKHVRRLPAGRLETARNGADAQPRLRYDRQFGSFNEDLADLLGEIEDKLGPRFGPTRCRSPFHEGVATRAATSNNCGPRIGLAWDAGRQRHDQRARRLRDVLRQHAHAAELRRADLAAGARRSSSATRASPIRWPGKSRDQFISTAPPNITVMDNATVNPYAHQFNIGLEDARTRPRQIAATHRFRPWERSRTATPST